MSAAALPGQLPADRGAAWARRFANRAKCLTAALLLEALARDLEGAADADDRSIRFAAPKGAV